MTQDIDSRLLEMARVEHPQCFRWYGVRGGGTAKRVQCYVCDRVIDTFAAKFGRPKHVDAAIAAHRAEHERALNA